MATGDRTRSVFVLGAGYIGMSLIGELLKADYNVTALVRRQAHAEELAAFGVTTVMGSLDDSDLITAQSSAVDVVFHTASADHASSALAILEGVQQRVEKGLQAIYIHNSGGGVLDDGATGRFKTEKVYKDDSRKDTDTVPDSNPHRSVDLTIVSRQREIGVGAKIVIMIAPLIYGYDEQFHRLSIQTPALIRFAIKRGYAGHVEAGRSVWSTVHVKDLARGYLILLRHMEGASADEFLENPYTFCEVSGDDEPSWRDIASVIGRGLHALGKITSAEPQTIPPEAYVDCAGPKTPVLLGMNSRSRAVRLRQLGWNPTEKPWDQAVLEEEIPVVIREC